MNIIHDHRCSGCGAPRQPGARYCRYCSEYVGVTRDLAVAVRDMRTPEPGVRRPTMERAKASVPDVAVNFGGWFVRVVCIGIVAVPVTLTIWSIVSAILLVGF